MRIDEIRARVEAYHEALYGRVPFEKVLKARYDIEHHAYSDLEYLLAEAERLQAENERLKAENRWILTAERLPADKDANAMGEILAKHKSNDLSDVWLLKTVLKFNDEFYMWRPLPKPPEGDKENG